MRKPSENEYKNLQSRNCVFWFPGPAGCTQRNNAIKLENYKIGLQNNEIVMLYARIYI